MEKQIVLIRERTSGIRQQILAHPIYQAIQTIEDLRVFMAHHVYAVWDFMSLLKSLQNKLTCTTVPWFPTGDAETRFLINEIVVGEESDLDQNGIRKSHFELYLDAMEQCGADTQSIRQFIACLQQGKSFDDAFAIADTPQAAREFVTGTFDIIRSDNSHLIAAVFTFGREDLIPGMFMEMVRDMQQRLPDKIDTFVYYLERHIEIDGDHHSHLAIQMTTQLCGEDAAKWEAAQEAVLSSLERRKRLWQGAYEAMKGQ